MLNCVIQACQNVFFVCTYYLHCIGYVQVRLEFMIGDSSLSSSSKTDIASRFACDLLSLFLVSASSFCRSLALFLRL